MIPIRKVSRPALHQWGRRPVAPQRTDRKERDAGHQRRGPQRGRRAGDEGQQRNRPAEEKGEERHRRGPSGRAADPRQTMLLGHHGVDPTLALGRDHVDGAVERRALETLGMEDLADLLALAFGSERMPFLHVAHLRIFLDLGLGAGIVGGGHREAIGEQIGGAQDQQGLGRKLGAGDAGHHRKGGHRAVDAAIDPVAQIADVRPVP